MMIFYNIGLHIYSLLVGLVALRYRKARLWREGRKGLLERMERAISANDRIVWFHVSSLGEFEQGRSLIESVKRSCPEHKILITFFSPSGYETCRGYRGADYIFYLPLDTPRNATRFLDIAHPEIAIFVKYEYWFNTLSELRNRGIRSYLVSAIFRPNSVFFKWWGTPWRRALRSFKTLFVQDDASRDRLKKIGFDNVIVAGDTRFDRVAKIAKSTKRYEVIERFKGDSEMLIAGSTWLADERLLQTVAERHPDLKIVVTPHEIDSCRIAQVMATFGSKAVIYSQIERLHDDESQSWQESQVLILDTMGMLSSLYQYGDLAYIGGGFGEGIHNTLEAATFSLPISFGTNYHKFKEATDLISLGIATSIKDAEELDQWVTLLTTDRELRHEKSLAADQYISNMCGATPLITQTIFPHK